LDNTLLKKRREGVFGIAVLFAGLAILSLCLMRVLLSGTNPEKLFPTLQQEHFFFDLLGIICGCWLLSWVSAVNAWWSAARVGQWLGIIMLCAEEAILVGFFTELGSHSTHTIGAWAAPVVVQIYLIGFFFGFFTLPSLTQNGNLRLTGLGTLLLILPWLFGREIVISGLEYLHGLAL
jgi:hypothetical protein